MRKQMRTGVVGVVVVLSSALVGCSQIKIYTQPAGLENALAKGMLT